MQEEWEIDYNDIAVKHDCVLGKGGFGKVVAGRWRGSPCAIKVFDSSRLDEKTRGLIANELKAMELMHHPNVVHLFGFTKEPFGIVMEVMPYCLKEFIEGRRRLTLQQKLDIFKGIFQSLAYIHNRKPTCVIHRDIKPSNILLTASLKPKLCDFGVSKLKSESNEGAPYTREVGSLKYMSPEMIRGSTDYGTNSDVYSAGVIGYELFENTSMLYPGTSPTDFKRGIVAGNRPAFKSTPQPLRSIIEACWAPSPSERPTALHAVDMLERVVLTQSRARFLWPCSRKKTSTSWFVP